MEQRHHSTWGKSGRCERTGKIDFLTESRDLFAGRRCAHMGVYQYSDHAGMRDGRTMSGARLWAEAEAQREAEYKAGAPNKLGAELVLLKDVAHDIVQYIPRGTDLIELGPGTLRAFRKKTVPLLRALGSTNCYIVDKSAAFLHDIKIGESAQGITISAIEDDFFLGETAYLTRDVALLACAFGGIISNLIAPLSDTLPDVPLTSTLRNFAKAISRGWILVAFDSSEDSREITAYYAKHAMFQLNIFDRMAVELPIAGDFDPTAFEYATEWRAASNQLAHMAVLNRDMAFTLGGEDFALKEGQLFHIKNSFKFAPNFFERCCAAANLTVTQRWLRDDSCCYLLAK